MRRLLAGKTEATSTIETPAADRHFTAPPTGATSKVVRRLLAAGAVVNQTTDFGSSPLTLAAYKRSLVVRQMFTATRRGSERVEQRWIRCSTRSRRKGSSRRSGDAFGSGGKRERQTGHGHPDCPRETRRSYPRCSIFRRIPATSDEARKRREELESLVEPGESGDHTSNSSGTPLTLAACNGQALCVDCLLLPRGGSGPARTVRGSHLCTGRAERVIWTWPRRS